MEESVRNEQYPKNQRQLKQNIATTGQHATKGKEFNLIATDEELISANKKKSETTHQNTYTLRKRYSY